MLADTDRRMLMAQNEILFPFLVESEGPSKTVEGEMLRAINRILYRYRNDGDYWWCGYGCETAGPAAAYLMSVRRPNPIRFAMRDTDHVSGDLYEDRLLCVLQEILSCIKAQKGNYGSNGDDMQTTSPLYDEGDEYEDEHDD